MLAAKALALEVILSKDGLLLTVKDDGAGMPTRNDRTGRPVCEIVMTAPRLSQHERV